MYSTRTTPQDKGKGRAGQGGGGDKPPRKPGPTSGHQGHKGRVQKRKANRLTRNDITLRDPTFASNDAVQQEVNIYIASHHDRPNRYAAATSAIITQVSFP
jgi:hypothetical protein